MSEVEEKHIAFQGEVQLAGWSENHDAGCKVTFWLGETEDLDAFRAMTCKKGKTAGQRLMLVAVEIGDDEQPVEQMPSVGRKHNPLTKSAGILCSDKKFQSFALSQGSTPEPDMSDDEYAAQFVREWCEIESRKELDTDPAAARKFAKLMAEYREWYAAEGHV